MSIDIECPCGKRFKAPDGSEGRLVRCPSCGTKSVVFSPPGPAPTAPAPVTGRQGQPWEVGMLRSALGLTATVGFLMAVIAVLSGAGVTTDADKIVNVLVGGFGLV